MPAEPEAVVRRFFEALHPDAQGDVWDRLTTADLVYVEDPRWPGSARYEGRPAVRACWEAYVDTLGTATEVAVRELRSAEDRIVAVVSVAGRAPESEVPFDHTWGYVCRVSGDRLSYFRAYFDPREAFEAAGFAP